MSFTIGRSDLILEGDWDMFKKEKEKEILHETELRLIESTKFVSVLWIKLDDGRELFHTISSAREVNMNFVVVDEFELPLG